MVEHRAQVEPGDRGRELAMPRELRVEHWLDERSQEERVVRRDEVDRRAHHREAHDSPVDQRVTERLGGEAREP